MKKNFSQQRNPSVRLQIPFTKQRAYWAAIGLASLACGAEAHAQTITNNPIASGGTTNVTKLEETTVSARLDVARSQIQPALGATQYTFNTNQIANIPGGDNASFNELLLRAPGVVQDSATSGGLHVRGEHANLQYRINDVLLPEGIAGFGVELDTRFIESMSLITGALPAQYGFRTAGIVDIQTKSGAFANGGEASVYGGSYDTIRPSFEYGGSTSNFNYYLNGSYFHSSLGIENPTPSHDPVHDKTDQGKFFAYMSYILDDTSRVSLMLSAADNNFQVPNAPGDTVNFNSGITGTTSLAPAGTPAVLDSANVNENQNEQNYYVAITYQKSAGDLNLQVSALGRRSTVHFMPDQVGDLYFNGVASDVDKKLNSGGLQADASLQLGENHTLRGGVQFIGESVAADTSTIVYHTNPDGTTTGNPFPIVDNQNIYGLFTGFYLQDEWKMFEKVTVNYGARFDVFNSSFDNERQFSPRVNLIYQPLESTTLHAGYAHYFTPPAPEFISGGTLAKFAGTSNDAGTQDSPIQAERSDYLDVGISQKLAPGLTAGVDAYYKHAKNQIDDGLFGASLIPSTFNYSEGEVKGVEFTASYTKGGFASYANVAINDALGTKINSAQFLFDPVTLAYTDAGNYIHLDHHELVACSFGVSYLWKQCDRASLQTYVDAIYGSGLRTDLNDAAGNLIVPNGGTVPVYYTVNVGAEERVKVGDKKYLTARFDVVNLTDRSYVIRDGAGVGVGAPQFGQRRSFYGTLGFRF